MLIEVEKDLKENDVVSIKLGSGEELISRFVKEEDNKIVIKNPMVLVMGPNGLAMQPFMFSAPADGKYSLSHDQILCVKQTDDEIGKQFIQQTTNITI